jgi:hypothetical protein
MDSFPWVCSRCGHAATIREDDTVFGESILDIENEDGERYLTCSFIVCPNPKCKRFTLTATLKEIKRGLTAGQVSSSIGSHHPDYSKAPVLKSWQLIPESKGKPFPTYIPEQILNDYNEACLISDLSPKASATLSRRCLQGIIRDFWGVKGRDLKAEIEQIKDKVEALTWQAIDAVRNVGNIGAHMEKDVNLIIDIEPKEAELLINLIETLLKDWYIARHDRESQLTAIVDLAKNKKIAQSTQPKES